MSPIALGIFFPQYKIILHNNAKREREANKSDKKFADA